MAVSILQTTGSSPYRLKKPIFLSCETLVNVRPKPLFLTVRITVWVGHPEIQLRRDSRTSGGETFTVVFYSL